MDILQRMPRFDQDLYKKECEKNYDADAVAGNVEDLTKAAVLLFLGFVDGATSLSTSCGGGGGNPESGWGRDPKEDELEWARRCAQMARQMSKTMKRIGLAALRRKDEQYHPARRCQQQCR